jgi:tetratricopeptide (TPR) repeat protein
MIEMIANKLTVSFLALGFTLCAATASVAFPGSGTTKDPATTKPTAPVKKSAKKASCKRGETAKRVKRAGKYKYICVKLKADILPDAELYQQARLLADEGEYEWALDHLRLIHDQQDPEVLNYTGYANRKAGRLETGIGYYKQALALNANYVQAREYLGEAYVLAGFDNLALEQLQEIANRGGTSSEAYLALAKFMREAHTN